MQKGSLLTRLYCLPTVSRWAGTHGREASLKRKCNSCWSLAQAARVTATSHVLKVFCQVSWHPALLGAVYIPRYDALRVNDPTAHTASFFSYSGGRESPWLPLPSASSADATFPRLLLLMPHVHVPVSPLDVMLPASGDRSLTQHAFTQVLVFACETGQVISKHSGSPSEAWWVWDKPP